MTMSDQDTDRGHTDDCIGGEECAPIEGEWQTPLGTYVEDAKALFDEGDDPPWCRIRALAFVLKDTD